MFERQTCAIWFCHVPMLLSAGKVGNLENTWSQADVYEEWMLIDAFQSCGHTFTTSECHLWELLATDALLNTWHCATVTTPAPEAL